MKPTDYSFDQTKVDTLPTGITKTYLDGQTNAEIDFKTLMWGVVEDLPGLGGGGGGTLSINELYSGNVDVVNIHGAGGTVTDVPYTGTPNAPLTQTGAVITATAACIVTLKASLAIINSAVNNRSTYQIKVLHTDSGSVTKRMYQGSSAYIRDDNNTYDSGVADVSVPVLSLAVGDRIIVQAEVLDAQTAAGTTNPNVAKSQLFIDRVLI